VKHFHCFACCCLLALSGLARADNWPQWRGPDDNGISSETGLPTEWGPMKSLVWQVPLPGMGGSTPIVWGERIFLTSAEGEEIVLLCLGTDGQQQWKRKLGTGRRQFRGNEGNNASSSPSTDGSHVYAFCGTGDFVCFDFAGNEVWRFNAQERYGNFRYQFGMHTTPLLYGDRLYLSLLHLGGMWVIALDKATGKEVWKVERPTDGRNEGRQSYASPCMWHNGSEAYMVVHGCDYTTAHRLSDGSEIWRLGDLNPKNHYDPTLRFVASPVAAPDLIVVPTAKSRSVVGVKPQATGLITVGSPFEQWRMPRGTPDVPSPLIHDGLVYLCREMGMLICLDAPIGKKLYEQRLHGGLYRSSPVFADGKIYLTARDGTFSVVKAGPQFELLAANTLPDTFSASPAVSNHRLYLRGFNALYAVGNGEKTRKDTKNTK
jgi:outer membrane protein assembly factor BamB